MAAAFHQIPSLICPAWGLNIISSTLEDHLKLEHCSVSIQLDEVNAILGTLAIRTSGGTKAENQSTGALRVQET